MSSHDKATTAGMLAARSWLTSRGLTSTGALRWHAGILLDVVDRPARSEFDDRIDTRFRIEIYSEEWGFFFCHGGQSSWIRVTDIAFVHGRDDLRLLGSMPALRDLGGLIRSLEHQHGIRFRRRNARVTTNLPVAEPSIRRWVELL